MGEYSLMMGPGFFFWNNEDLRSKQANAIFTKITKMSYGLQILQLLASKVIEWKESI
jgi:hypothetical protein